MQSEFTLGISFKIVFDYNFVLRVSLPPFLCSETRRDPGNGVVCIIPGHTATVVLITWFWEPK